MFIERIGSITDMTTASMGTTITEAITMATGTQTGMKTGMTIMTATPANIPSMPAKRTPRKRHLIRVAIPVAIQAEVTDAAS
jgi:uncharacterized oligopeptide transporter (OPT) family protein